MQHLAHWTFTQRTIHIVLPIKPPILRHEKPNPTGTLGDAIRAARKQAGLTREKLSKIASIPIYWLGRWERDRSEPSPKQWIKLKAALPLSI
jgi:DNA-binding transcriptional regulator YiaG